MAGNPGGVVHHVVQGEAGVHDAPGAPGDEAQKAQDRSHEGGVVPGRARIQPKSPLPPLRRPANSRLAATVKAVMRLGTATKRVRTEWIIFQVGSIPGSANWW